jgi:hypothetical protein
MKHVVKHDLDQGLARKAADKAWEAYSERFSKYNPKATWTSETHADIEFTVKGMHLKGSIDLEPGGIALELEVPFVLRVFKKQAIDVIEKEIQKWIDKAKAGELD